MRISRRRWLWCTTSVIRPFGHAGERALDKCLQQHGLRFDHNLHALRIVEHFEQRYAAHRGLNLTLAVREGHRQALARLHPAIASGTAEHTSSSQYPPLEAQIIDLADEIAYLTADLDDGVESGLLEIGHIREHVRVLLARAYDAVAAPASRAWSRNTCSTKRCSSCRTPLSAILIADTRKRISRRPALRRLPTAAQRMGARVATFSPGVEAERIAGEALSLRHALHLSRPRTRARQGRRGGDRAVPLLDAENPGELPEGYAEETETGRRAAGCGRLYRGHDGRLHPAALRVG